MGYSSILECLQTLIKAYYKERNVEGLLQCVTEDIEWIGTEGDDYARGKEEVRRLLEADVKIQEEPFFIEVGEPVIQYIGEDAGVVTLRGSQEPGNGSLPAFKVRGTLTFVKTKEGWLAKNIHISVPNAETEKYKLTHELNRKKFSEQRLLSAIRGGIAQYRMKKDGRVSLDFISEGLAKILGFDTPEEFLADIKGDARRRVVPADLPRMVANIRASAQKGEPINEMYRVYDKQGDEIMVRLDGTVVTDEPLDEEDAYVMYAVHTFVSAKSKKIIQEQEEFKNLINKVPNGIGIFEVHNGVIGQMYLNDAFYQMTGIRRRSEKERKQNAATEVLDTMHPEDVKTVEKAMERVMNGENLVSLVYRIRSDKGSWCWLRLVASVIERKASYVKFYASFSDYNSIIASQEEEKKSKDTLQIALESTGILAWRYDYKTGVITDSGTLGEAYKLPKVIPNGCEFTIKLGFLSKESIPAFRQMFAEMKEEKKVSAEVKTFFYDGEKEGWYKLIYTPVFGKDGKYQEYIGTAVDITEQKNKEQKYLDQLRLNRQAAQDALSKVYINLSQNKVVTYDNIGEEYGWHGAHHTADDLLASIEVGAEAEEVKKFALVKDCRTIMENFKKGISHLEIICHLQYNENTKWTKVIYDVMQNPYTGDYEMLSSVHDITDRVRSELVVNKLLEVAYKSILLIDNATGRAYPFTENKGDTYMQEINDGMEGEGDQSKGLEDFFRAYCLPDKVDEVICANSPTTIKKELEKAPAYETMYTLMEDGRKVQYKVIYTYLEKDKRFLLSAVQDVTRVYEDEIRQKETLAQALVSADAANKAKTAFLSRISHDMRTPLNGILGITSLMQEKNRDEATKRDLEELEMSGKYLLSLINDTLDVSRIENGKLELRPVVCDGRELFNTTIELSKAGMEAKNISLHVQAENLPFTMLYVDRDRIQQVIMNVLGNAVKFTPEGGSIDFSMRNLGVEKGVITDEIKIKDSGIGISPDFLPHIFEAFSQEDGTKTSSFQGTGLGMAITKQLLNLMGGDISVESELGKGSTFTITLKLQIASKEQLEEWEKEKLVKSEDLDLEGRRFLLCEDHPLNAKIAMRLLEKKGAIVEHAENGKKGVEMFSVSLPGYYDAILMDIRMPVMDGIEAAKAIRSLPRQDARMIPIVAMTANAFTEDIEETKNAGMDAHLSKPIQIEHFFTTLSELSKADRNPRRRKILVVDDIEVNRAVIRCSLENDYDILEAASGKEAMEILTTEAGKGIEVVITDIQMPHMDGIELIKEIKSHPEFGNITIIANTQFGNRDQEEKLLQLGASDFIYKPTTPKIVEIRVRNAIRRL